MRCLHVRKAINLADFDFCLIWKIYYNLILQIAHLEKNYQILFWRLKRCQFYVSLFFLAFQTYLEESLYLNNQLLID